MFGGRGCFASGSGHYFKRCKAGPGKTPLLSAALSQAAGGPFSHPILPHAPTIVADLHIKFSIRAEPPKQSPLLPRFISRIEQADGIGLNRVTLTILTNYRDDTMPHARSVSVSLSVRPVNSARFTAIWPKRSHECCVDSGYVLHDERQAELQTYSKTACSLQGIPHLGGSADLATVD